MKKASLFLGAALVASTVVSSCEGGASNEASTSKETVENDEDVDARQKETDEVNEDLLTGDVSLVIDGEEYGVTAFDKRRSEITWMNDNKIAVRLNSLDRERSMKLLISGDDAYGEKPLDITLDASQYEKANHGGLTFTGFLGESDNLSTTQLRSGKATVKTLDTGSLKFEMSFQGQGLHSEVGGIRDTVSIAGDISVRFDHAVDSRSKE